jgi:hypothetical protein
VELLLPDITVFYMRDPILVSNFLKGSAISFCASLYSQCPYFVFFMALISLYMEGT